MGRLFGFAICASIAVMGIAGCNGTSEGPKTNENSSGTTGSTGGNATTVNSQGSTFIQPFFSKAFEEFGKTSNFQINYTGGGSSAGIKGVMDGVIPFGASDAPLSDEDIAKAGKKILNLPVILGSITIVYNIPGVDNGLKLDGPLLADIFMNKVAKWNDPRIAEMNPGVKLPDLAIAVQVRADGSGSTYVLSDYLSNVSPEWSEKMGKSKTIKWGDSCQQWKGSDGVTANTKQTPGSISYTELSWATKSGLQYCAIKNAEGAFVLPDAKSTTAAANGATIPEDFRASIVNAKGAESYPISTFSFVIIPEDLSTTEGSGKVVEALKYVVGDAQAFAEELGYAPLPKELADRVSTALGTVKTK